MTSPHLDDVRTARTDRRAQLIEVASRLFSEHAYDEVTTTEIAKRANVAYGLIAHHFSNKRGLYLATILAAAEDLRRAQATPSEGDSVAEQLHNGISRHISFMDHHAAGFLTLMRGGNGSDPEVRAIIEEMRWEGALRVLRAVGVHEPVHPVLRAAMRGWVGYLDELIIDHIQHHDVAEETLAQLAITALATTLRTARSISSEIGIDPRTIDTLR